MEITPASSTPRTTKVRATKPAVPKSGAPVKKPITTKPAIAKPVAAETVTATPKAAAAPRKRKAVTVPKPEVSAGVDLTPMIATAAYYLAEQRHFAPGYEMQDWLAAELMIRGSMTRK